MNKLTLSLRANKKCFAKSFLVPARRKEAYDTYKVDSIARSKEAKNVNTYHAKFPGKTK